LHYELDFEILQSFHKLFKSKTDASPMVLLEVSKTLNKMGFKLPPKKLFDKSLKEVIRRDPKIDKFYVHASPYSIPIYKKMGFIETDNLQEENGMKYLPMEITIKK